MLICVDQFWQIPSYRWDMCTLLLFAQIGTFCSHLGTQMPPLRLLSFYPLPVLRLSQTSFFYSHLRLVLVAVDYPLFWWGSYPLAFYSPLFAPLPLHHLSLLSASPLSWWGFIPWLFILLSPLHRLSTFCLVCLLLLYFSGDLIP